MAFDLICSRWPVTGCGFRVPERYFRDKPKFAVGLCPRCSGRISVVDHNTDDVSETHTLNLSTSLVEPVEK
jgi:hypothetical protein